MATRGLRSRGSVGQPRSCQPCRMFQGTPDPLSRATSARMSCPASSLCLAAPAGPVGQPCGCPSGLLVRPCGPPFCSFVGVPCGFPPSVDGSITRTIERLRFGSPKGKRLERNPEVVPTNVEDVPRPSDLVHNPNPACTQEIPKIRGLSTNSAAAGQLAPYLPELEADESAGPCSTVTSATFHLPETYDIVRTIRRTSA